MSFFNTMLQDDARNTFCNPDEFGETGTYKPFGGVSFSTPITVTRKPTDVPNESGIITAFNLVVFLPASTNISSINPAGDILSLATNVGGAAEDHPVVDVLTEDVGGWTLLLR